MVSRGTALAATALGVGGLIVVGAAAWFGFGWSAPANVVLPGPPASAADPTRSTISVHVSGAVRHPGIVQIDADARLADVVLAAGGATTSADLARVNLAAPVRDGEHVTIPTVSADGEPQPQDTAFDLNSATATELETLPGVGPVLAARIVSHRDERGPFGSIEDLLDVPGIGESKLAAIRDFIESS